MRSKRRRPKRKTLPKAQAQADKAAAAAPQQNGMMGGFLGGLFGGRKKANQGVAYDLAIRVGSQINQQVNSRDFAQRDGRDPKYIEISANAFQYGTGRLKTFFAVIFSLSFAAAKTLIIGKSSDKPGKMAAARAFVLNLPGGLKACNGYCVVVLKP